MTAEVRIIPVRGVGEVRPGDDLARLLLTALDANGQLLAPGDVLVVTQKIVSKAEGRLVDPAQVEPSAFARQVAAQGRKDAAYYEVVLRESRRIVKMANGVLITETPHGLICANSGVDESNVAGGQIVSLLPEDPDASAARLRAAIREAAGVTVAVIISDTFGRPWREGQVNVAIGCAGIAPLIDYAGATDPYGYTMQATLIAVADELASAAELVMGKIDGVPAAIVRGYAYTPSEEATARRLIRDPRFDLFR
ncbi:MAG: coenzyme F420-0:L-glutamate ligase [Oscillochloridaceae bacterium]|nr:coenzyme F420-0:L-glutamate ligase [Chloroflexaceae bacterium]MDW8392286.1 coenzyme F420-0:L-glutamate ligase [Oscillochloridaceae bacterium]